MSSQLHVSPMGGVKRSGRFKADEDINSVTLIGGVNLDLSEAEIPPAGFTINKYSVVGGVHLIVPPGTNVDLNGFSLLGGHSDERRTKADPKAPTIHVKAYSLVGGITVEETGSQ